MEDFPSTLWPEGTHLALLRAALLDGEAAAAAFREWRENIVFDDLDGGSFRLLPLLRWNLGRLGVKTPSWRASTAPAVFNSSRQR